jgi:hypothetical protein
MQRHIYLVLGIWVILLHIKLASAHVRTSGDRIPVYGLKIASPFDPIRSRDFRSLSYCPLKYPQEQDRESTWTERVQQIRPVRMEFVFVFPYSRGSATVCRHELSPTAVVDFQQAIGNGEHLIWEVDGFRTSSRIGLTHSDGSTSLFTHWHFVMGHDASGAILGVNVTASNPRLLDALAEPLVFSYSYSFVLGPVRTPDIYGIHWMGVLAAHLLPMLYLCFHYRLTQVISDAWLIVATSGALNFLSLYWLLYFAHRFVFSVGCYMTIVLALNAIVLHRTPTVSFFCGASWTLFAFLYAIHHAMHHTLLDSTADKVQFYVTVGKTLMACGVLSGIVSTATITFFTKYVKRENKLL